MSRTGAQLCSLAELQSLLPQNSAAKPRWPVFRSADLHPRQARLGLWVPADLYWFDGHFAGRPVLAGVVQTHWAATLGAAVFQPAGIFAGIEALKFHRLVAPATELALHLGLVEDMSTTHIRFVFYQQTHTTTDKISEGRLRYR